MIKMKINVLLIFIIGFVCITTKINAQTDYSKVNIASPNAAALGKFVDVPVNYHTGIPQINIPIYTLKEGSIELPISLSYHAGGIKVAEAASWVGTGWALNAGGVITRTIRGIADEGANSANANHGYFANYGLYNNYPNGNIDPFRDHDNAVFKGTEDAEPDLFFFNFNGHTGQFYFNDDRTPILVSGNEDLKIDYVWQRTAVGTSESVNIQGFTITTNDGTKYFFGKPSSGITEKGVAPIEMSFPTVQSEIGTSVALDRIYSSWYLYKIESADKADVVKLFYEAESFSTFSWSYFPPVTNDIANLNASGIRPYSLSRMYVKGVRLAEIVSSQGNVAFNPSEQARQDLANGNFEGANPEIELPNTEARALKEIVVSANKQVIKKMQFNTNYFNEDEANAIPLPTTLLTNGLKTGTDRKRLKLESIVEVGSDGQSLPPYRFDYYSNVLPRRLSFAIDHWGFYNAARNANVLPALTKDTYTILNKGGANRESAWPAMQNGALTKVTYPTGGSTDFEFEANRAKINALRYNLEYVTSPSVGYDGSYTSNWPNVILTGNDSYELIFSNSDCGNNIGTCSASYRIVDQKGNVVASGGADADKTVTYVTSIPPGTYTIKMSRNNSKTTKGATLTISKFKPYPVVDPIVGGLRIKTITKNPANGLQQSIIERYSYDDANRSSGILYERPYYVSPIRNTLLGLLGTVQPTETDDLPNPYPSGCLNVALFPDRTGYPAVTTIISPVSSLPMQNVQGNHIGYKTVTVSQDFNGSSVYRYFGSSLFENNIDDVAYRNLSSSSYCDPKIPNYPAAPLPYNFERGELQAETHFDAKGQLLRSVNYKYGYDSTKVFTPGLILKVLSPNGGATTNSFTEYTLRGYWKKYSITNETLIDKSTFKEITTSDTLFYASPYHRSVTRKGSSKSTGGNLATNFKYAFDFIPTFATSISDGWDTYQSSCKSCDAIYSQRIATSGITTGGKKLAWFKRRICLLMARKSYVDYRRSNFTDPSNLYATTHLNSKNNADIAFKPILEMQDQFINAPIETTTWVNGKLTGATFNSFGL